MDTWKLPDYLGGGTVSGVVVKLLGEQYVSIPPSCGSSRSYVPRVQMKLVHEYHHHQVVLDRFDRAWQRIGLSDEWSMAGCSGTSSTELVESFGPLKKLN